MKQINGEKINKIPLVRLSINLPIDAANNDSFEQKASFHFLILFKFWRKIFEKRHKGSQPGLCVPWTRLLCTFTLLLHQGNLLSNVFFLVSATIFLQIYRTGQWSYEIYPHFHQKMKRRIRFFLFLNRFYFQCVLFEASIMLLNFRKKSPQSLPPQFQGNAYNVFKEI